jgi:hypothetical protein
MNLVRTGKSSDFHAALILLANHISLDIIYLCGSGIFRLIISFIENNFLLMLCMQTR